jgi:hypothetical protein
MGWSQQDWELDRPEDKVRDHLLSGDSNRFRNMVGNVEIGWPDCANTLGHSCRSSISLNGMPEQGSSHADNDGEASEVPAERGAHGNREWDMETSSNYSVQNERDGTADGAEYDTIDSLTPASVSRESLEDLSWLTKLIQRLG